MQVGVSRFFNNSSFKFYLVLKLILPALEGSGRILSMKSILLFMLFSSFALAVTAQSRLTGRIVDDDGVPIKGASVRLLHWPDSSLAIQVHILADGSFHLKSNVVGEYKIHYSAVGHVSAFSEVYQLVNENQTLAPVHLSAVEQLIDAVEVVGRPAAIRQYADKMVVDVSGSVLAEGNNVLELLEKTPGIIADGKGNFSIQGRAGAKVRIDGRDMYVSGEQLASILRGLQASEVSKLELMANPSAREDAEGTAGIINIITKRNTKVGFGGDVFVRAGQGRSFYGGFGGGVHYKVNGLNMYLQGNKSDDRSNSHNWAERNFYEQGKLMVVQKQSEKKWLDDGTYHSVRAGAKYEFEDGGILDGSVHWMEGKYKPYAEIELDSWIYATNMHSNKARSRNQFDESFKNWTFNINYSNKYDGEDHFLKFNFDFAPHGNDYNNRFETDMLDVATQTEIATGRINVQDLSNTTYAGRLDYSRPLNEASKVELGWKGTYFFIKNDVINMVLDNANWVRDDYSSNRFQYTQHIEALYGIYSGKYKKIEYQAGIRGEYTFIDANQLTLEKENKQRYFDIFPSGSVLYHVNGQHTLRSSFSSRVERPGDHDINVFRIYEDTYNYHEGNPDLKPEKSYILELGHGFKNRLFSTLGMSYGRNIIQWITRQGDRVGESLSKPDNIGEYLNYTASVMYNQTLFSFWTANHYVNAFYNDYRGDIDEINLDSKGSSCTANSKHTLQLKYGFRTEVSLYYRSGITIGATRTDERYGLDIAAEKKVIGDRGMIKLAVTGLIRNANPRLTSQYGDLKIFSSDFPDNRKAVLSLSYRFGN